MQEIITPKAKDSFADLLDDNLSQILLMIEKMKIDAWKSKDEKSIECLGIILSSISKLYDARLELAENLVLLKN